MKLLAGLVTFSLGLAANAKYEPKCGIICLSNMDCAGNSNAAPLDSSSGLPVNVQRSKRSLKPGSRMMGSAAQPGMYPWMAGIYVKTRERKGSDYDQICGGSIMNSRTIITAASCFTKEGTRTYKNGVKYNSRVLVGFPEGLPHPSSRHSDISSEAKSYGQGIFEIEKIIMHPRFSGRLPEEYDAAILVLKNPIVYHESIDNERAEKRDITFQKGVNGTAVYSRSYGWTRPACFANGRFDKEYLVKSNQAGQSKANCFATGYGKDQAGNVGKLNSGFMKFVQRETCKNQMNTLESVFTRKLTSLPKSIMCAHGEALNKVVGFPEDYSSSDVGADAVQGACEGDTGAPLNCMVMNPSGEPSQFIQTGVTAMGLPCGEEKMPNLYTRISGITSWMWNKAKPYGKVQFRSKPDEDFKPRGK